MKQASFHVLRVGLAITFLWIGILILKSPEAWGGYLQPWAMGLLPLPIEQMMIGTAILDIVIGVLLLVGVWTWIAAALAAFHIAAVLVVSGINAVTVRDIGLLAGTLAVFVESMPPKWQTRFRKT